MRYSFLFLPLFIFFLCMMRPGVTMEAIEWPEHSPLFADSAELTLQLNCPQEANDPGWASHFFGRFHCTDRCDFS